ncbi:response regulator transcription factor [Erysipelothrix aquatica]|uniref:response regulator transcription factor n=1 Tax=Erysipelothrix aquatica TaxID=2683714 RepID=UPI0013597EB3|nr:response regulator transcription factor [Erysipelothrix aquatica]
MKIFLLEDDAGIVYGLRKYFKNNNWDLTVAFSIQEGERLLNNAFDIIILDVGLPDGNGLDFARYVRSQFETPIVFLTAMDDEITILEGFSIGADDYITKPFRLAELDSRIRAIAKRSLALRIHDGDITINLSNATVYHNETLIMLSVQEYRLLVMFVEHKGEIVSREMLNQMLWQGSQFITDNALTVTIKRLREKLANIRVVESVHGKGYRYL